MLHRYSYHPQMIRKTKALIFYWLNNHPAEIYTSCTEIDFQNTYGETEDSPNFNMLVKGGNENWVLGDGDVNRVMIYQDPDRWHDINKTIISWLEVMIQLERNITIEYFHAVKGEPIDRWKHKYISLPVPDWCSLVGRFISQGYF